MRPPLRYRALFGFEKGRRGGQNAPTPALQGGAGYMQVFEYMCQNATLGSGFFTMWNNLRSLSLLISGR